MATAMDSVPSLYDPFDLVPGENPLRDGGKWGEFSTRPPLKARDVFGDSVHGTVEFPVNGSVYRAQVFTGPTVGAFGCMADSNLGAANESNRIVALYGDPDNYVGYSSGWGGGITETYFFRRYNGGGVLSFDTLGETLGPGRPDKLGIRITPEGEEQWGYVAGVWILVQSFSDLSHRGPVRFALETEEQGGIAEVSWTCFGAGVLDNRTQIYRVVRGLA